MSVLAAKAQQRIQRSRTLVQLFNYPKTIYLRVLGGERLLTAPFAEGTLGQDLCYLQSQVFQVHSDQGWPYHTGKPRSELNPGKVAN